MSVPSSCGSPAGGSRPALPPGSPAPDDANTAANTAANAGAPAGPRPAPGLAARRAWMAVLARTPRADLEAALERALHGMARPAYDWLRAPETGLAMVRGRVGGTGDPFNLGEATLTRATLRLRASGASGASAASEVSADTGDAAGATLGVACHLGRDRRRAELAALADALLQLPEYHATLHRHLIEPFAEQQAERRAQRQRDVAATRVEFFTMVRGE